MSLPTDHTPETFHPIPGYLSERDLYADITIYDDLHETVSTRTWLRISELTEILAKSSHIANHVRTLRLVPAHGVPGSQQDDATSSLLNGVASLLPLFAQLTSFEIVGNSNIEYYKRCDFPWHTIPETFILAFQCLLCSQTLKFVYIRGMDFFPMSLLNDCKHLSVTIECCNETQDDKNSANVDDQPEDPVPFEHLSIQSCDETSMKTIALWVKTHGLRSLDYVNYSDPLDSLPPLLIACSKSLTDLRIQIDGHQTPYHLSNDSAIHLNGDVVHYSFTLAKLPHLTRLTVRAMSYFSPSGEPAWTLGSPLPTIMALVSTASPSLQNLSIEAYFMFQKDFEQLPDPVIIWTPFIPLAIHCSSASISLNISTSFWLPSGNICNIFSPFTDYKGLTPYVQRRTVVMSDGVRKEHRAFDLQTDRNCPVI